MLRFLVCRQKNLNMNLPLNRIVILCSLIGIIMLVQGCASVDDKEQNYSSLNCGQRSTAAGLAGTALFGPFVGLVFADSSNSLCKKLTSDDFTRIVASAQTGISDNWQSASGIQVETKPTKEETACQEIEILINSSLNQEVLHYQPDC